MLPGGKHGFCQVDRDTWQKGRTAPGRVCGKGNAHESYMAECICTELLWKAYEELNEKIRENMDRSWKDAFPGSELPLEAMEGCFPKRQTTVSFNRFYVLSPKKAWCTRHGWGTRPAQSCVPPAEIRGLSQQEDSDM